MTSNGISNNAITSERDPGSDGVGDFPSFIDPSIFWVSDFQIVLGPVKGLKNFLILVRFGPKYLKISRSGPRTVHRSNFTVPVGFSP